MMIEIDKGIELAAPVRGKGLSKYPIAEMDVGDSFLIPQEVQKSAAYAVAYVANLRLYPKRFTVRNVGGDRYGLHRRLRGT